LRTSEDVDITTSPGGIPAWLATLART